MDGAWIALVGTLVGGGLSFLFQRINMSRSEEVARAERMRERRIQVYSDFAESLMDWRRSQVIRSSMPLQSTSPSEDEIRSINDENRRARATAWTAFYQVKLLVDDPSLEALARDALAATRNMKRAMSRNEINNAGDEVRRKLEQFLDRGAQQVVRD